MNKPEKKRALIKRKNNKRSIAFKIEEKEFSLENKLSFNKITRLK